jgi:hypothetical protein
MAPVLTLSLIILTTLSSPALAQGEHADIKLIHGYFEAGWPNPTWNYETWAMPPLGDSVDIGTKFYAVFGVYNNSPNPVTVDIEMHSAKGEVYYDPLVNPLTSYGRTWEMGGCGYPNYFITCKLKLWPNDGARIVDGYRARFPGELHTTLEVTSPVEDPVPENNQKSVMDLKIGCSIDGTEEDDELRGTDLFDSLCGGGGDDRLIPEIGDNNNGYGEDNPSAGNDGDGDILVGGAGDDIFEGGRGDQIFFGGPGHDVVDYSASTMPVHVSLAQSYACGDVVGCDRLIEIEEVIGTPQEDYLAGSLDKETLRGLGGSDRVFGRRGNDQLFGGNGQDRFISDDENRDFVSGGNGQDVATLDRRDRRASVQRQAKRPFQVIKIGR